MHQRWIEIIDPDPFFKKAGLKRGKRLIGIEKRLAKCREHGGKRQFNFGMTAIDRRIDKTADLTIAGDNIAAPQIAMQ